MLLTISCVSQERKPQVGSCGIRQAMVTKTIGRSSHNGGPGCPGRTDDDRIILSADANADTFSIGEMSAEFGFTLRALRFYENRGLISPRHDGHLRIYQQSDRARLALIRNGRKLGFTVAEIGRMLVAQGEDCPSFHLSRETCVEQINMLERQKRDIETALVELRQKYSELYIATLPRTAPDAVITNPTMWRSAP
jgi:DNA-binding transcriptional MerR regulator